MADFDDLRLDKTAPPPPPSQPRWIPILAAIVLILALLAVWYYMRRGGSQEPTSGAGAAQTEPPRSAVGEQDAASELPPLAETDALVREMVRALSQHPIIVSLLTTDQLIRTFAVSVMNIADGDTPSRHLFTIKPDQQFHVRKARGRTYIDPRSYARFDPHAAAVDGLDPAGAARLYERLKPRISEAYRELAGPNADFDRTLQRAIVHLLRTPVIEDDVALEPAIVGYTYADESLESLSRAQQQLLRMGPANVRRVQQKLRALARELGIEESSLPAS